jgi:adenylate cyclase
MSETRKLAAILCSDVVGYSRLAGADEDRILARLRTLRSDLIDPTIAVHHGRIVKRTGDGSIVEFRSIVDAVRCAIELQSAMVERNAGVPEDRRIVFRIGIHLGDVVEESDGDLMGDGVNIAARLEGIAAPGAICLSEDAYRQVKGRLDLGVTDLGPTQLKNIAEPVRAYSLEVGKPAKAEPATVAKPLETPARPPEPKKRAAPTPFLAAIAALLVVIAVGAWYFLVANRPSIVATKATAPVGSSTPAPAEGARFSIIVLPFTNLSGDPTQDYLVDALTDELTTSLARNLRPSFVIARNTAFTYKGKPIDVKAIGKDLGVHYVLEGSVQPSSAEMRVNAQLIEADTGVHLWAEQFDTPRANLLQMQDEIVTHLARALALQLPEIEATQIKRTPTTNPDAADLSLQCMAAEQKVGFIGAGAEAGFRLCEQALAIDPKNVHALSVLSFKFWLPVLYGRSADPKSDIEHADELLSRALAIDPEAASAHLYKSYVLGMQFRLDDSIAEAERALELNPVVVNAYESIGNDYLQLGQFEKSLAFYDKAVRLSPHDPLLHYWYQSKAGAYFGLKQYDQSIEWARRAIAINPNNLPYAHAELIAGFALTARDAEAQVALQSYLALHPTGLATIAAWKAFRAGAIRPHSNPRWVDFFDRLVEGLGKAGMPEQ